MKIKKILRSIPKRTKNSGAFYCGCLVSENTGSADQLLHYQVANIINFRFRFQRKTQKNNPQSTSADTFFRYLCFMIHMRISEIVRYIFFAFAKIQFKMSTQCNNSNFAAASRDHVSVGKKKTSRRLPEIQLRWRQFFFI